MNKAIFVLSMVLALMLSGCATQFVCDDGTTVTDPSMCPVEEVEEEEEEQVVVIEEEEEEEPVAEEEVKPVTKAIDDDVQKLFDKVTKYNNYEYTYIAPKNEYVKEVKVMGDLIKEVFPTTRHEGDNKHGTGHARFTQHLEDYGARSTST